MQRCSHSSRPYPEKGAAAPAAALLACLSAAGAAALTTLLPATARAQAAPTFHTVPFQLTGSEYGQTVQFTRNGRAENAYACPYLATIDNVQKVPIFCVDVNHNSYFGETYLPAAEISRHVTDGIGTLKTAPGLTPSASFYDGGLASIFKTSDYSVPGAPLDDTQALARAKKVVFLADQFLYKTDFSSNAIDKNTADNMTALSLSIWDIMQDGGDGMGAGSFQSGAYNSLVSYYETLTLNNYNANPDYTSSKVIWVQAPRASDGSHAQDYMMVEPDGFHITSIAPEAGAFTQGVSAFSTLGLWLGFARLRRRRNARLLGA